MRAALLNLAACAKHGVMAMMSTQEEETGRKFTAYVCHPCLHAGGWGYSMSSRAGHTSLMLGDADTQELPEAERLGTRAWQERTFSGVVMRGAGEFLRLLGRNEDGSRNE